MAVAQRRVVALQRLRRPAATASGRGQRADQALEGRHADGLRCWACCISARIDRRGRVLLAAAARWSAAVSWAGPGARQARRGPAHSSSAWRRSAVPISPSAARAAPATTGSLSPGQARQRRDRLRIAPDADRADQAGQQLALELGQAPPAGRRPPPGPACGSNAMRAGCDRSASVSNSRHRGHAVGADPPRASQRQM